jgi:hypothetical protein
MNRIRRTGTALTLVAALALPLAPASAAVRTVGDPVGDAPPAIDAKSMVVDNGDYAVRIVVRYKALDVSRVGMVYTLVDIGAPYGTGYYLETRRRPGTWRTSMAKATLNSGGDSTPIACRGLRFRFLTNRLVIRLPRTCMKGASNRVRVETTTINRARSRGDAVPNGGLRAWTARG